MAAPAELPEGYYLDNFQQLLQFVQSQYVDLLNQSEQAFLTEFNRLSTDAKKLYVRLIQRKGPVFRSDKLNYPEINALERAIDELAEAALLQINPVPDITTLASLMIKTELLSMFHNELAPYQSERKGMLVERLLSLNATAPALPFTVLQPLCREDLNTFLFLFFGNSSQDMTEFVLQDLGLTRFENYPLSSRLFNHRHELEQGLHLSYLRRRFHDQALNHNEILQLLNELPPSSEFKHPVTQRRYSKLINTMARALERQGALQEAKQWYECTHLPPSRERQTRILAKLGDTNAALALCTAIKSNPASSLELAFAQRFARTLAGEKRQRQRFAESNLYLEDNGMRVEFQAQAHFNSHGWQAVYVENTLITGLAGLWFWDIIFADIKGAFFHPFQTAPADLTTPDFYPRRKAMIDQRLQTLMEGNILHPLKQTYQQKKGVSNRLVNWAALNPKLIELAATIIPTQHLYLMFKQLMFDIGHNRTGFPDLILFDQHKLRYQWVEVKGPGDRLQENQKLWLAFFQQHGIPAEVAFVQFFN